MRKIAIHALLTHCWGITLENLSPCTEEDIWQRTPCNWENGVGDIPINEEIDEDEGRAALALNLALAVNNVHW